MIHLSRVAFFVVGAAALILLLETQAYSQGRRGGGDESRRRDGERDRGDGGGRSFAERFRERFGGGGDFSGGGFGGGWGGGGGQWGGGGGQWGGGGAGGSEQNADETDEPKEKPRVTVDLPEGYLAGDLDHDGQVGYYEWRLWQRTGVAQFARWDTNHDGFLTPKELIGVTPPSGSAASPTAVAATATAPRSGPPANPFAAVSTTRVPAGSGTGKPAAAGPVKVDPNDPIVLKAKNYFSLMDENKDGSISADELEKSNRVKSMFKNAGIDLTQPMNSDQFVETYVRVSAS